MLIAITGGIGSGKSVVSSLLSIMGFAVYDCDRAAKRLMTSDPDLRQGLTSLFGADTYLPDGSLNRPHLAQSIFGQPDRLAQMNALVHPAVGRDLRRWYAGRQGASARPCFFESAILYESGFDRIMPPDRCWCVAAPDELRIRRAMERDHAQRERIESRMASQMPQDEKVRRADLTLLNDETHSIIAQVRAALDTL